MEKGESFPLTKHIVDLVAAGEYRRAGAMYADLLETYPGDFEPADDDDNDDEEEAPKWSKFPGLEMAVGQRTLRDERFASRITIEPALAGPFQREPCPCPSPSPAPFSIGTRMLVASVSLLRSWL